MSTPIRSPLSRRSFLRAVSAVAGASALAACTPQSTKSSGGGGGKEISILDDTTNNVFEPLFAKFAETTGIKVRRYQQMNFNDLHDRLATSFGAQDTTFDVVMTWAAWSAEFGQAGWLQPLSQSDVPEDVNPSSLDAVSWGGQLYGLPKFISVQTMFYNKRLFREAGLDPETPPSSWDEFVAAVEATSGGGRYGFATDMGNSDGAYQNFLKMLLLNGGSLYGDDNQPVFNGPAGIDALERLIDLRDRELLMPSSLQITHSDDLSTSFVNERVAAVFNWPFQYAKATASGSRIPSGDLGNAILPGIEVRSASIDGSEGFAINKFSRNKAAALEWLRFVTSPEVQREIVLQEGWLPVSSSLLQDQEIIEALPVVETYAEQADYSITRGGAPWYNEMVEDLASNITKAMLGQVSAQDALDSSASAAEEIIQRSA
jgi:multiple sugar transport system substrate-binding protein